MSINAQLKGYIGSINQGWTTNIVLDEAYGPYDPQYIVNFLIKN